MERPRTKYNAERVLLDSVQELKDLYKSSRSPLHAPRNFKDTLTTAMQKLLENTSALKINMPLKLKSLVMAIVLTKDDQKAYGHKEAALLWCDMALPHKNRKYVKDQATYLLNILRKHPSSPAIDAAHTVLGSKTPLGMENMLPKELHLQTRRLDTPSL